MYRTPAWNRRDDDSMDEGQELHPPDPGASARGTDKDVDLDREMVELIREAKVERLRREVRAGAYTVNVERLARRMLSAAML
jgi:anti-sigma28 factor (negative regulator of flagellin synthesis)